VKTFLLTILLFFILQFSVIAGNRDKVKAAEKTISGKITAINGEKIAGVKIIIKETNETFFADLDGSFKMRIKTDKSYSIIIESLGYASVEVKSADLNYFSDFNLKEL